MILSEKIIKLRKQLGWSQEDLAEKMDVSRQSVSKWESTNSIPDLNKIIKLSELFAVSTDFLLKDNLDTTEFIKDDSNDELTQISLEEAIHYTDIKQEEAKLTSKGTMFCICSPTLLFFLLALSQSSWINLNEKIASGLGVVSILFMISAGVAIFIKQNKFERALYSYEKAPFNLAYGVHSAFSEKLESYTPTYNNRLAISVTLFITSAVPLVMTAIFFRETYLVLLMLIVLLGMIALGLSILLPVSAKYEAYKHILNEGDEHRFKKPKDKYAEQIGAIIWPLAMAIYLGWSFWTGYWHITWIVFPVTAMSFIALIGLMDLLKGKKAQEGK